MRRLLRSATKAMALGVRPSLLGAAYMLALTALASSSPLVAQGDRALGAQAREVSEFVTTRFGDQLQRLALAIGATAVAMGLLLGALAGVVVQLRQWAAGRAPFSGMRLGWRSLGVMVAAHGWLVLYGMARSPQLYADAWYARGGVRRTVEVLATDVLGARGALALGAALLVAFVAGTPSAWAAWPHRVTMTVARLGLLRGEARVVGAALLPVALLWALWPSGDARAGGPRGRPNVIILAADSLRADRLTTSVAPHLSALAARGTRFDRAYVSLPRTFPSWVTILTGRHAHHHGVRSMFPRWEERAKDFDALPERLAKAGYATGVVSDYAGDVFSRIDLGFQRVDVPSFDFRQLLRQRALERQTPMLPLLHSRMGRALFPVLREMNVAADPNMLETDAERAVDALSQGNKPFFLTVFFSTAHFPYAAPSPYYARYTSSSYRGRFKYDKPVGLGDEQQLDDADVAQVRALYDGAVTSIDDAAQRLLAALDRRGLAKDTIFVVTADHGETLFDHGHGQGHDDHLFGDEGTHVPLVIVDPRVRDARRDERVVRDVDLAPTIYDLLGVEPPKDLDGISIAPALSGKATPPRLAYAETELWMGFVPALPDEMRLPYPGVARLTEVDTEHHDELVLRQDVEAVTTVARHRMVRDERYKLVYVPERKRVEYILYDTQVDPGETANVAAEHPDVVARLRGELWAWMRQDPRMVERGGYLVTRDAPAPEADARGALRVP
ncbi:MAG TPA: sulfatase [Polyangiaceae bacterium]|nr:sulfatase [Polyangiaceae bacterium]